MGQLLCGQILKEACAVATAPLFASGRWRDGHRRALSVRTIAMGGADPTSIAIRRLGRERRGLQIRALSRERGGRLGTPTSPWQRANELYWPPVCMQRHLVLAMLLQRFQLHRSHHYQLR